MIDAWKDKNHALIDKFYSSNKSRRERPKIDLD